MKKLILTTVIIINLLSAKEIILKKDKNSEILINSSVIDRITSIIPDYLKPVPEKYLFKASLNYDSLYDKKPKFNLSVNLKFPALIILNKKTNLQKNPKKSSSTKSFLIKIRPYFKIRNKKLDPYLSNTLSYKYKSKKLFSVSNRFNFYSSSFWEEEIIFLIKKDFTYRLSFSTDKDILYSYNYSFGIYKAQIFYKKLINYGLTTGGNNQKDPFIYYYKLFLNYRHSLFGKRYIYGEISPYLLFSKEFDFYLKPAIYMGLTVKF